MCVKAHKAKIRYNVQERVADVANRKAHLAQAVKTLRKKLSWSLDKAAAETGVSKAMLGQIERQESSPTIDTLWKIATGFSVSLSSLLEPLPSSSTNTEVRKLDELRRDPAGEGMQSALVFPYEPRFGFEYFELALKPGYERISQPHEAGVVEHIVVTRGKLEILINESWQVLESGQAIRFAADQKHGYRNKGDLEVTFQLVIHYPSKEARLVPSAI